MKKNKKIEKNSNFFRKIPKGLRGFLAAFGLLLLILGIMFCVRTCEVIHDGNQELSDDASAPDAVSPTSNVLRIVPAEEGILPFPITESISLDQIYTAAGHFPEDGSDEAVENVLAVKLTNTSSKTLEYLTFTLTVNETVYPFSVATVPAGKSIYVFNRERKNAPDRVTSLEGKAEVELHFSKEPSTKPDILSYDIQNGTVVVTNMSEKDIKSDIIVYYKSTADAGYFGGITYRFRIVGGLAAGQSFSAYAPHAYSHMTEIMFTQYEE